MFGITGVYCIQKNYTKAILICKYYLSTLFWDHLIYEWLLKVPANNKLITIKSNTNKFESTKKARILINIPKKAWILDVTCYLASKNHYYKDVIMGVLSGIDQSSIIAESVFYTDPMDNSTSINQLKDDV